MPFVTDIFSAKMFLAHYGHNFCYPNGINCPIWSRCVICQVKIVLPNHSVVGHKRVNRLEPDLTKHQEMKRLGSSPSVIDDFDIALAVGSVIEKSHQSRAAASGTFSLLTDVVLYRRL